MTIMDNLKEFGKSYMHSVRDWTTTNYLKYKAGEMSPTIVNSLSKTIEAIKANEEVDKNLDYLIREIIDTTLHHTLFMFETSEQFTIALKDKVGAADDVVAMSDGLSGELYGKRGWYAQYSENKLGMPED